VFQAAGVDVGNARGTSVTIRWLGDVVLRTLDNRVASSSPGHDSAWLFLR